LRAILDIDLHRSKTDDEKADGEQQQGRDLIFGHFYDPEVLASALVDCLSEINNFQTPVRMSSVEERL